MKRSRPPLHLSLSIATVRALGAPHLARAAGGYDPDDPKYSRIDAGCAPSSPARCPTRVLG